MNGPFVMRTKTHMTGPNPELTYLIAFLNRPTPPKTFESKSILGDMFERGQEEIEKFRESIGFELRHLVAPDTLNIPTYKHWKWRKESKDKGPTPLSVLYALIRRLNAEAVKPKWSIEKPKRNAPKIELRGLRAAVVRNDFGMTEQGRVWGSIAKLFETGEIAKLGQCDTCLTFFEKNRYWQQTCLNEECRRKYDNKMRLIRRGITKAKSKRRTEAPGRKAQRPGS
jgi:hypothetical protein